MLAQLMLELSTIASKACFSLLRHTPRHTRASYRGQFVYSRGGGEFPKMLTILMWKNVF